MKALHLLLGLGGIVVGYFVLRPKTASGAGAGQGGSSPPAPGSAPPAGGVPGSPLMMVGDPMHLVSGQYYEARLTLLKASLPPFSADSTIEQIGNGLVAIGFKDVRVYMGVADLPSGWPQSTAVNADSGTRWFSGMWGGPTEDLSKPYNVEQMWMKQG